MEKRNQVSIFPCDRDAACGLDLSHAGATGAHTGAGVGGLHQLGMGMGAWPGWLCGDLQVTTGFRRTGGPSAAVGLASVLPGGTPEASRGAVPLSLA